MQRSLSQCRLCLVCPDEAACSLTFTPGLTITDLLLLPGLNEPVHSLVTTWQSVNAALDLLPFSQILQLIQIDFNCTRRSRVQDNVPLLLERDPELQALPLPPAF